MYKPNKIASILGTATLVCFSFYYTESAVDIVRKSDPIMKEIESYSKEYGNTSIDAILIDNSIIPGVKGQSVDLNKSYDNMKRLGKYDKSLLVFKEEYPSNRLTNNYDKYIVSGNKTKNSVGLIITLKNTDNIEELLKILGSRNIEATFFIPKEIFDKENNIVKLITLFGNEIELLSDKYSLEDIKKYTYIKEKIIKDPLKYCYVKKSDENILNNCKSMKMYTIKPIEISNNYPYSDIKEKLDNGLIITLNNNSETIKELPSIIKYINQKGKKIEKLENLLKE